MEMECVESIEFRMGPRHILTDVCVNGMDQADLALVHTTLTEAYGSPIFFIGESRHKQKRFHFVPNREETLTNELYPALRNKLSGLSAQIFFCKDERAYIMREIFNKLLKDRRLDEERIASHQENHHSLMQAQQMSDEMERGEIESSRRLTSQISSRVVPMLETKNKKRTAIIDIFREEGWCGHCNGRDCGEKISASYITSRLTLLCPDCLEEAASQ